MVWFLPTEKWLLLENRKLRWGISPHSVPKTFSSLRSYSMKPREKVNQALFQLLVPILFGIHFLLLGSHIGCQKQKEESEETKRTVTVKNLQTAYAKSVNYARMYTLFRQRAEKDRLVNVANLYRAVSRSEQAHADLHAGLLRKNGVEPVAPQEENVAVGTTLQTLKLSMSSEEIEFGSMYPNLIHSAELEKDSMAAAQFRVTKEVDSQHAELFKEAFGRAGRITRSQYFFCPGCGYILTSEKTEECPICHSKNDKFEKV
jgi:rubrerythrin